MNRRFFVQSIGAAGIGALLSACGGSQRADDAAAAPDAPTAAADPSPTFNPVAQVTDAEQVLTVLAATYEQIAGATVPFAFGVRTADDKAVSDADLAVYVVPDGAPPEGPFDARSVDDPTGRDGLYLAELPFDEPGMTSVVVVTGDEQQAGSATIPVATAETSAFPAPGDEAPVVATPTFAAPLGAEQVCTQEPPCDMHEVSLDDALAQGRPVVVQFATPAYCQTAVCGPSVAVLDEVRQQGDWGDTAFIHCEIYADAGQNLLEPITAWNLPSEPWMYTIDAQGRIDSRTDGVLLTLPDQVSRVVSLLQDG